MGLDLVFGALSLAVGVVNTANASANAKKSAAAQRESNNIAIAQGQIEARENRRQLLREERLRRARLMQGAQNTGTAGSSGETGALSAIGTNVAGILSAQAGQEKANVGINKWNQRASDYDMKAREAIAWGDVFQSGIKTFGSMDIWN